MSVSPYLLKGQKALVTGANSGIGEAIARYLAQAGAAVVVNYQSKPEAAQKIVDDIKANQGEAMSDEKPLTLLRRHRIPALDRRSFLSTNRCCLSQWRWCVHRCLYKLGSQSRSIGSSFADD